jgi:hypothetical protein
MPSITSPALSVAALFAERDARHQRDKEADDQLKQRKEEEVAAFKKRLDGFQLTDEIKHSGLDRIKRAFEHGETELMIASFPSAFCTDDGRAIINAGEPPINKPTSKEPATLEEEPDWLTTLPAGVRQVYNFWKEELKPGGFKFSARVIDFPGGKPGDVGLFFSWPKDNMET